MLSETTTKISVAYEIIEVNFCFNSNKFKLISLQIVSDTPETDLGFNKLFEIARDPNVDP